MVRLKAGIVHLNVEDLYFFQFQYGAIEGFVAARKIFNSYHFQFQYGAIEGLLPPNSPATIEPFQFQYGAIEGELCLMYTYPSSILSIPVWCDWRLGFIIQLRWSFTFNSSMVRLKVAADKFAFKAVPFQFQYGAIEGCKIITENRGICLSIPVWCDWRFRQSMLYRHEPNFQFQYGAIEGNLCSFINCIIYNFQFQYGAIEGFSVMHFYLPKLLSIPVWCDWRIRSNSGLRFANVFQFQYGAIEGSFCNALNELLLCFQFQYGAIEGYLPSLFLAIFTSFQFQYGAIEGSLLFSLREM